MLIFSKLSLALMEEAAQIRKRIFCFLDELLQKIKKLLITLSNITVA